VNDLSWFLAGLALGGIGAVALWRRRRPAARPTAAATAAAAAAATPPPVAAPGRRDRARQLANAAAAEVATLASGIEGGAHALIEAAANRSDVPRAAEGLLVAVRRLRSLHARLSAIGGQSVHADAVGTTDVARLIARLTNELQRTHVGLELHWQPPDHLPELAAPHDATFDALASACRALLRAEAGATRLSIAAESCYDAHHPQVRIECTLEWSGDGGASSADLLDDAQLAIDREAARVLTAAHGGEAVFQQSHGRLARVVLRWPVADAPATDAAALVQAPTPPAAAAADDRPQPHRYGGALLLESDPAVRAMLAAELKATGRAVFVCADAAAASTFLRATPDRFEVLIVDRDERLADRDLAAAVRAVAPALDLLSLDDPDAAIDAQWPQLRRVRKPFGVHELRRVLASLLAAGGVAFRDAGS
jgi:hypothetical protein